MKPGYKTSEFWLVGMAQGLAGTAATGVFNEPGNPGWVQVIGMVISAMLPLAYAWIRGKVKQFETEMGAGVPRNVGRGLENGGLRTGDGEKLAKTPNEATEYLNKALEKALGMIDEKLKLIGTK